MPLAHFFPKAARQFYCDSSANNGNLRPSIPPTLPQPPSSLGRCSPHQRCLHGSSLVALLPLFPTHLSPSSQGKHTVCLPALSFWSAASPGHLSLLVPRRPKQKRCSLCSRPRLCQRPGFHHVAARRCFTRRGQVLFACQSKGALRGTGISGSCIMSHQLRWSQPRNNLERLY